MTPNYKPPARPYWSGFLKLSLVTTGVRLYTATTSSDKISFNMLHRETHERVRQQLHVPGTGLVDRSDIVKGYEYAKDQYVVVDDEELKNLKLSSTTVLDITETVDRASIPLQWYDTPYYLLPDGPGSVQGYRVIAEALARQDQVAIGQVVVSTHERVVAIYADSDGHLLAHTLRYPDELRQSENFYAGLPTGPADADEVAMMCQLASRKHTLFDPGKYVSHYAAAVKELVESKLSGVPMTPQAVATPPRVVNLMAAMKASLAEEGVTPPPKKTTKKRK